MKYVKHMLIVCATLFIFGCSNDENSTTETNAMDENDVIDEVSEEELIEELKEKTGIDIEAIEEEIGIDKSDSATIPGAIPSDIPLPDDMEIDFTIENELMSQVWLLTELSRDDLTAMYEDYLNSNFSDEVHTEDHEMEGHYAITYTVPYEDNELFVQIIDEESESKRTVSLTVSDFLMEMDE